MRITVDPNEGLHEKFHVTDVKSGEDVQGAFVLLPEKDPIAAAAVMFYADIVKMIAHESVLQAEVEAWLQGVEIQGESAYNVGARLYNQQNDLNCW